MIFVWYVVTNSRNHIQCLVTRRIAFLKKKKKNIIATTNSVWLLLVWNLNSVHIIVFLSRSFLVAAETCLVPKFIHTFPPFTVLLLYKELIWRFTKKVNNEPFHFSHVLESPLLVWIGVGFCLLMENWQVADMIVWTVSI